MVSLIKSENFLKYFKNTFWIFTEQFVKLFSIFIVNIFIARHLGPENFGVLAFATSVVAIALTISRLGMESVLVRELISNIDRASAYVSTAFVLIILAGIFSIFLLYLMLIVFGANEHTFNYILCLSIALIPQAFLVLDYHFQSQVRAKYSSLAKSTALIISAIIKLYLVSVGASLDLLVLAIMFESVLIALFLIYVYRKKQSISTRFVFDRTVGLKLIKSSYPMLLASLTTVLYMRIDQLMIKAMLGDFSLGVYSAVSRVYELWVMVTVVLCISLLPAIVKLKEKCNEEYENRMILFFRGVIGISLLLSILSATFGEYLIQLLFGSDFNQGVFAFQILMWSSVFAAIGSVTMRYLTVERLEKKVAQRAFVALGVNVVLNLILIPTIGINGAAFSTLVSLAVANYFIDYFDKDLVRLLRLKHEAILMFKMKAGSL